MENLRHYYENDMGWSAGPHAFIDGKSWWIFTPFNVKGVHSPSWNGTMLGFECVGDYDTESDESGMGAEVMKMAHQLSAEVCDYFGWNPEGLKFHKEDPATDHDCPGSNMVKGEFINDVQQCMGDGGDDHDRPMRPHRGTVRGLAAGDTLNIRAASSSSAPIIGAAENGDQLIIVGEAWNGSTKWLRIQFGRAAGAGVEVFGWASAQYIAEEPGEPDEGAPPEIRANHQNVEATVFGGAADGEYSAYPPYDSSGRGPYMNDTDLYVALPYSFPLDLWPDEIPKVRVFCGELSAVGVVADKGPWLVDDIDYVDGPARPLAETCHNNGTPLPRGPHKGKVPSNKAGIDLSPALAEMIGVDGKGIVSWQFVDPI
jgi:hypothetical protein